MNGSLKQISYCGLCFIGKSVCIHYTVFTIVPDENDTTSGKDLFLNLRCNYYVVLLFPLPPTAQLTGALAILFNHVSDLSSQKLLLNICP